MTLGNAGITSKAEVFDALAQVAKAFGNGRRLEIVELLAQGEHSVETVAAMLGAAVTTTSSHLQTLKQAGVVSTRRERSTIFYRLASDDVAALFVDVQRAALRHSPALRDAVASYLPTPAEAEHVIAPAAVTEAMLVLDVRPRIAAVTEAMLVLDVRPRIEFEAGHFPGAMSIPQDELEARARELPFDRTIVLYCRGELCRMARESSRWLRDRGFDARAMDEGVVEWRVAKDVELDVA